MAYMEWTHDLDTGIKVIDDQHKRLVELINELHEASLHHDHDKSVHAMEGLLDYTVTHFEFEEELMGQANYEFYKAHQRIHEIFMKKVAAFRERANSGEDVTEELLNLLQLWLRSHIKSEDRDYIEIVKPYTESSDNEKRSWISNALKRFTG